MVNWEEDADEFDITDAQNDDDGESYHIEEAVEANHAYYIAWKNRHG